MLLKSKSLKTALHKKSKRTRSEIFKIRQLVHHQRFILLKLRQARTSNLVTWRTAKFLVCTTSMYLLKTMTPTVQWLCLTSAQAVYTICKPIPQIFLLKIRGIKDSACTQVKMPVQLLQIIQETILTHRQPQ